MDPNLDLDVVSLDKGIADLQATGTSTWDFQSQDCDPLSLATRLKALKERDTTTLLTFGGQPNSSPQPQGACKAARYCCIPSIQEWNLQPNTFYSRPDGLWGRITISGWDSVDYDIRFSPYITMMCASTQYTYTFSSQTAEYTVNISREGGEDANLQKNMCILIEPGLYKYNTSSTTYYPFPAAITMSYSGTGTSCLIKFIRQSSMTSAALITHRYPLIKQGKNFYVQQNFCCYPMYYGFSPELYNSSTEQPQTNISVNTEPLSVYPTFAYRTSRKDITVQTTGTISTTLQNDNMQLGILPYFTREDCMLVDTVPLGSRFSSLCYNIPEEWQTL